MIEISVFNLALLVEVMVILVIVCGIMGFLAVRRRSKVKQSALKFAAKVKASLIVQKEQLAPILEKFSVPEQDGVATTVEGFVEPEKELFNGLLNVFVHRDANELFKLGARVGRVTAAYQAYLNVIPQGQVVQAPPVVEEVAVSEGDTDADKVIAQLTAENAALSEENAYLKSEAKRFSSDAKSTLETMSHMLTEYSALYGAGDDARSITMDNLLKSCRDSDEEDRGVVNVGGGVDQPLPVTAGQEEVVSESVDQLDDEIQIEVATDSEIELPIENAQSEVEVPAEDDDDIMIEIEPDDADEAATDIEVEAMLSDTDEAEEPVEADKVQSEASSDDKVSVV